jgi:pantetheine-phosphate adenylyltransferase
MRTALYPGTFDPITLGHLDVLERAAHLFDRVILVVAPNESKHPLFSTEERVALAEANLTHPRTEVRVCRGLMVDFAREVGAVALIRGLRAISDFEYEFQIAQMNRNLSEEVETLFLMPSERYFYSSSSILKQVARYTDRDTGLVPQNVRQALAEKFADGRGLDHPPEESP